MEHLRQAYKLHWRRLTDALLIAMGGEEGQRQAGWRIDAQRHAFPDDLETFFDPTRQTQHLGKLNHAELCQGIEDLCTLVRSVQAGTPLTRDAHTIRFTAYAHGLCYYCGQGYGDTELLTYKVDGRAIRADTACPMEDGAFSLQLAIPSGILAIGNDFESFLLENVRTPTVNESLAGKRAVLTKGAQASIVSMPLHEDRGLVYRQEDGSLLVGTNELAGTYVPEANELRGYWRAFADGDRIPVGTPGACRVPVAPGMYAFTFTDLGLDRKAGSKRNRERPQDEIRIRRIGDLQR